MNKEMDRTAVRNPSEGFTLIEILIVIAIIAVVAAILFPALASAKRSAKQAVSISNLRQCGIAANLYANDNGGIANLPHDAVSSGLFGQAPTCDPLDYWRKSCSEKSEIPMVGSYAYAGEVFNQAYNYQPFDLLREGRSSLPLMADIFVSSDQVKKFSGVYPPATKISPFPDKCLFLLVDGSVRLGHRSGRLAPNSNGYAGFSWPELFLNFEYTGKVKKVK